MQGSFVAISLPGSRLPSLPQAAGSLGGSAAPRVRDPRLGGGCREQAPFAQRPRGSRRGTPAAAQVAVPQVSSVRPAARRPPRGTMPRGKQRFGSLQQRRRQLGLPPRTDSGSSHGGLGWGRPHGARGGDPLLEISLEGSNTQLQSLLREHKPSSLMSFSLPDRFSLLTSPIRTVIGGSRSSSPRREILALLNTSNLLPCPACK